MWPRGHIRHIMVAMLLFSFGPVVEAHPVGFSRQATSTTAPLPAATNTRAATPGGGITPPGPVILLILFASITFIVFISWLIFFYCRKGKTGSSDVAAIELQNLDKRQAQPRTRGQTKQAIALERVPEEGQAPKQEQAAEQEPTRPLPTFLRPAPQNQAPKGSFERWQQMRDSRKQEEKEWLEKRRAEMAELRLKSISNGR